MTSYCAIGERDFVSIFAGDENRLKALLNELVQFWKEGTDKDESDIKTLINCYSINLEGLFVIGGQIIKNKLKMDKLTLNIADLTKNIFSAQEDYTKVETKILNDLKNEKIIVGYRILHDFLKLNKIRVIVLLWHLPDVKVEEMILRHEEITKHIIEGYQVSDALRDEFGDPDYERVNWLFIAEFNHLGEYSLWMDEIYKHGININCFTLVIESIISEQPYTVQDLLSFGKLCSDYSCEKTAKVQIGNGIYGNRCLDYDICLSTEILNGHCLIIGKTRIGKTNTLAVICQDLLNKNLTVHLVDIKGEFLSLLTPVFGKEKILEISHENINENLNIDENSFIGKVVIYNLNPILPQEESIQEKIINILNAMDRLQDSKKFKHGFFFEESGKIFEVLEKRDEFKSFFTSLHRVASKGVGMFFIAQRLSLLPKGVDASGNAVFLYNSLQNRIFHCLEDTKEVDLAYRLLKPANLKDKEVLYDIKTDLMNLGRGEAYVSFIDAKRKRLPPIKVKIKKLLD